MPFKIKLEPEAVADIQDAIDWYNEQQSGLGKNIIQKSSTYLNFKVQFCLSNAL